MKKEATVDRFPDSDDLYNGDFTKYYDTTQKRNYWVLGYFGGGSLNIVNALAVAKDYAIAVGVSLESIQFDEIFKSSRYKGFKICYSLEKQEKENDKGVWEYENVWERLTQ